jgi:hypothetical protein
LLLSSLWKAFVKFTNESHPSIGLNDIKQRTSRAPQYIAAWIYNSCEKEPDSTLSPKKGESPSKGKKREKPATWSHALKMRAAASFGFVTEFDCDPTSWMQLADGTFYGNPSLSKTMTTYMKSLRKKKVSLSL